MSAPVDVLAVMDALVIDTRTAHDVLELVAAREDSTRSEVEAKKIALRAYESACDIRAAVAELVEAVSAVYGEPCFSEGQAADDPCSPDCMSCRIRAALAKFGGAA